MRIKRRVERLCRTYRTRDPFELAQALGILVIFEPLGSIQGYYNQFCRQRMLHINDSLSRAEQRFVCAHELGHAVIHPEANTPFLRSNTLFLVDKLELEANRFAVVLLYTDEEMREYLDYSIPEIASFLQLPPDLIEYRCRVLEPRSPGSDAPLS